MRRFEPFSLALILLCVGWHMAYSPDLLRAGAATRRLLWAGEYWRAPATIIVHAPGFTHLLLNCLGIYILGPFVARGMGGLRLLAAVFFSGMAGLGASLLTHEPYHQLVGISGGVMGLLGVILAVEWRNSTSVMGFFRQRNTRVVIFIILLNAILAVVIESFWHGVQLDHAAHTGGFFFGLVASLALIAPRGKSGARPVRALVVALLLGLGPVAYAAYPYWSVEFFQYRAYLARQAQDEDAERIALARWNELEAGNHEVAGRLAVLDDNPDLLFDLPLALADNHKRATIEACLELARRRLESEPDVVRRLVDRAREVDLKDPAPWLIFAKLAEAAGQQEVAALAYEKAALAAAEFSGWEAAELSLLLQKRRLAEPDLGAEELLRRALAAAKLAANASGGLNEEVASERRVHVERAVVSMARTLTGAALKLAAAEPPPEGLSDLYHQLVKIHRLLAENTPGAARKPAYRLAAARWFWRAVREDGPTDEQKRTAAGLFLGTLNEAREAKNREVAAQAALWFTEQGLPVPPPDPADLDDGSGGD